MAGVRIRGRWNELAMLPFFIAIHPSSLGCDGHCRDLEGDPCTENGVPSKPNAAICDECGTVWSCDSHNVLLNIGFPCSCINEDGYLDYGFEEDGYTWECSYDY